MKRTQENHIVVTLTAPITSPKGLVIKDTQGRGKTLHRAFMARTIECVWPNPTVALHGHWGDDPEAKETNVNVLLIDLPPEIQAELHPETKSR